MTRVKAKHQLVSDDKMIVPSGTEGTVTGGTAYKRGVCLVSFDNGIEMPVFRSEITLIRNVRK